MYPEGELNRLAAHKVHLQRRIALRRAQCVRAAARAVQPLEWIDRMLEFWRRVSPFAKLASVPLGFLLGRSTGPRTHLLGKLLRWGPLVLSAVRGLTRARAQSRPN